MKPERKLWQELKQKTPKILWTRIENLAIPGVPDLLGYNENQFFFTVELKISTAKKIRFSPHQIAFHKLHPKNTFILVKALASRHQKLDEYKLYEGASIEQLVACGSSLDACCSGLDACGLLLASLGAS